MSISTVILIKETGMSTAAIDEHYLIPLEAEGISQEDIVILPVLYNTSVKVYAKTAKAYLDKLIHKIPDGVSNLIIADSSYFKFITNAKKVSAHYGSTLMGAYDGYTKFNCVYIPSHKTLFKQPENKQLITLGLKAIAGNGPSLLINSAEYGFQYGSDRELLDSLHQYPVLAADIETTGLTLEDQIVSVSFAWSSHDGTAIDLSITGMYYLRKFFESYSGKLIFHGGLFDAKLLIRSLWMKHATDYAGMMEGLKYFKDFDDTMIMAYLAKNACTKVFLGLKEVALEHVGNYAIEITDITKYTKQEILRYNLIDALGTFYVWEKYQDELTSEPYLTIFQPSIYPILKMMLVGLPMDSDRVQEVNDVLTAKEKILSEQIQQNDYVIQFNDILRQSACEKANAKLKKLVKTVNQFQDIIFNPNSHQQIAKLLHEMLDLPVLELTKTKAPSTGAEVLENLTHHTTDQEIIDLLTHLQDLAEVIKINGTFIKAFMKERDFLHGSLKLGGTQSGRLSCLVGNSMVLSSEGLVAISDLTLSHKVLVPDGKHRPIINIWDNGKAPVYKITLDNGKQVTGTSNHRFMTKNGYLSLEDIYGKDTFNRATSVHKKSNAAVEQQTLLGSTRHSRTFKDKGNKSPQSATNTCRGTSLKKAGQCSSKYETFSQSRRVNPNSDGIIDQLSISTHRGVSKTAECTSNYCATNNGSKSFSNKNSVQGIDGTQQSKKESFFTISGINGRNPQISSLHSRQKRIFINAKTCLGDRQSWQQTHFCTSSSNDGTSQNNKNSRRICSTSCERRQDRQSYSQSSIADKRGSFKTASGYSNIQRVDFVGIERVYDVEVETDHCYLVNGIWSHNSSDPNLTNLPAHGPMGKLTKSCIVAPDGWLFAGADFSALEERIGAILSQDPNRIKVYAGTPVYEITINNVCHHVRADSTISYDGKHYTGEQFHEYWNSRS